MRTKIIILFVALLCAVDAVAQSGVGAASTEEQEREEKAAKANGKTPFGATPMKEDKKNDDENNTQE